MIFMRNRAQLALGTYNSGQQRLNSKAWRSRLKTLIVMAALWGLIPFQVAEFFIKRGGLRHD